MGLCAPGCARPGTGSGRQARDHQVARTPSGSGSWRPRTVSYARRMRSSGVRRLVHRGGVRAPVPLICQYIDSRKRGVRGLADPPGADQPRREGADLKGPVHHSDRGAQYRLRPLRGRPGRDRGDRICRSKGGTPSGFALAEALNSPHKAEPIRNRLYPDEHGPLGRRRRCLWSPPPSRSTGRAPPGPTPPPAYAPLLSTSMPTPHQQTTPTPTTSRTWTSRPSANPSRQPPTPDKPAPTKPRT